MAEYARRTCTSCGLKDYQPNMEQVEIEYVSGSSTTGFTARSVVAGALGDKKAQRQNKKALTSPSKRVYRRKRKVWMCPDCAKEHKAKQSQEAKGKAIAFLVMIGLGVWFLWFVNS